MRISELLLRKNNNLDLVRILLAMLVIVGHSQFLNGPDSFFHDPLHYIFHFTYSGAIAVKLFFFISGLVVANSLIHKKQIVTFLISRVFRLMPGLLLVLLATAFIFGPILTNVPMDNYFSKELYKYVEWNLFFKTRFTLPGVFTDNLYPNTVNGSLWSLRYEVGCYIVMLGIFVVMRVKNKYLYNIPILLIIVCTFFPVEFIHSVLGPNPERYLLPASFAFGVLCAVSAEKIRINGFTFLLACLAYIISKNTIYQELVLIYALSIGILFLASQKFMLKLKPKYDISYGIYLWGFLIGQTIYHYTGHLNILLHLSVVIGISVFFALLSYSSVEKPGIELGKRLSRTLEEFWKNYKKKKNFRAWLPKYKFAFLYFAVMLISCAIID